MAHNWTKWNIQNLPFLRNLKQAEHAKGGEPNARRKFV